MLADYHVHTEFSDDSEYEMEEVVKHAIEIGLDEICFTDHVDYGLKYDLEDIDKISYRGEGEPTANVFYPLYFRKLDYMRQVWITKKSADITTSVPARRWAEIFRIIQYISYGITPKAGPIRLPGSTGLKHWNHPGRITAIRMPITRSTGMTEDRTIHRRKVRMRAGSPASHLIMI